MKKIWKLKTKYTSSNGYSESKKINFETEKKIFFLI